MGGYDTGRENLDRLIGRLVAAAGEGGHPDLIAEIITTAVKLHRDGAGKGELKLFNAALKEMRYSSLVFNNAGDIPKLTIFGSARTAPDHPDYRLASDLAAHMRGLGWMVVTGAGPGIMEAGNRGAGPGGSFGVNIRLPFEASANPYIDPELLINFKYFFTRKLGFVKESHAFAIFPGGFGTMDEAFELLTLIQTGKAPVQPIVMMEAEGGTYWGHWQRFVSEQLEAGGMIGEDDRRLYRFTHRVEEAAGEICDFYRNYLSQRRVGSMLVLRLRRAPSDEQVELLNEEFGQLAPGGRIVKMEPTAAERRDGDLLHCTRLGLPFAGRRYGRLRAMIDRINSFPPEDEGYTGPLPRPLS